MMGAVHDFSDELISILLRCRWAFLSEGVPSTAFVTAAGAHGFLLHLRITVMAS